MKRPLAALACSLCAWLALPAAVAGQPAAALGLCPAETARLDEFMQVVCAGERALSAGRASEAATLFRHAAGLRRLQATNELAWAGLAAAHCRGRDGNRGREWAARFEEARRLWLGELACTDAARSPQPFVREHMCVDALAADYEFIRTHPDAAIAREMSARLQAVAQGVAAHCAAPVGAAVTKPKAVKATKKKRKTKKPLSGIAASPTRGR